MTGVITTVVKRPEEEKKRLVLVDLGKKSENFEQQVNKIKRKSNKKEKKMNKI